MLPATVSRRSSNGDVRRRHNRSILLSKTEMGCVFRDWWILIFVFQPISYSNIAYTYKIRPNPQYTVEALGVQVRPSSRAQLIIWHIYDLTAIEFAGGRWIGVVIRASAIVCSDFAACRVFSVDNDVAIAKWNSGQLYIEGTHRVRTHDVMLLP